MTVSIKVDDSGIVQTINYRAMEGESWVQISEEEIPEVTEEGVSVEYHWDGTTMTAETSQNADDEIV